MSTNKVHKKLTSFLNKTYEIVNDSENEAIVSWTSDGMGFTIKSVPDFTELILPRYFKHSNFASFVRQLNMYDFHKSQEDGCKNVFRHPCFLRGRKSLLRDIRRKSNEIATDKTLSKTDCQRLLDKVQELQHQHQMLEATVQDLRSENQEMARHNQGLLQELTVYKSREGKLEGLLSTFSTQIHTLTSAQNSRLRSSLDPQEPLICFMDEAQPLELIDPDKNPSDSQLDADKGEPYEGPRDYLSEAHAGPAASSDADMEAEIDSFLMPKE